MAYGLVRMDANLSWIKNEFSQIDCNDLRLNKRFMMVAESMMESPGENIHQAMGDWKNSKAAYRLFDNEKVKREDILSTHAKNTLSRVNDTKQERNYTIHSRLKHSKLYSPSKERRLKKTSPTRRF